MVNETSPKFTREELIQRAFLRIARNVHDMWEETGNSDTRLFMEPLIPDSFVIVGQSKAGGDHKEHVVPRVVICKKCHEMFANGESIEAVAVFIRKFLKFVRISKAEQVKLDKKLDNLNLRQRMPDGWSFESGDVFQRLRLADIDFDLFPDNAHP
jgi:hypothetical protein